MRRRSKGVGDVVLSPLREKCQHLWSHGKRIQLLLIPLVLLSASNGKSESCSDLLALIKIERVRSMELGKPLIQSKWEKILIEECGVQPMHIDDVYARCMSGPASIRMNKLLASDARIADSAEKIYLLRKRYNSRGCRL